MDYQLCCLDLTPDGKTLVDTELSTVSNLWLAPVGNTAKAKQITTKEFAVGGFSWMPDGRIIFASQDGNLYAVNQDGSGRTRLTPDDSSKLGPVGLWRWALHRLRRLPGTKTRDMAHECRWLKPHPHR